MPGAPLEHRPQDGLQQLDEREDKPVDQPLHAAQEEGLVSYRAGAAA